MPTSELQALVLMPTPSSALSSASCSCLPLSSLRREGTEKWSFNEDHCKASDLGRYAWSRAGTCPSLTSPALKNRANYEMLKTDENRHPGSSFVNSGEAIAGRLRSFKAAALPSPSPSSSPPPSSSSSSSAASFSPDADGPVSPEVPAISKRPRPLFVLSDKPDRTKQFQSRAPERPSSKEVLADNNEDDRGLSLGNNNPNHRSGYVALIGKPNVGKSTLMNCIIGQKLSIVTHKPQTTRHRILGICSDSEYQMILFDTPGMITKRMNKLDELMMQNVRTAALTADCVLVIVDATEQPWKQVSDSLDEGALKIVRTRPSLLVMNKRDTIRPAEIASRLKLYEACGGLQEVMAVSAKYGHGVDELKRWLVSKLPLGPAYYPKDDVSNQPEKFFASEIVREKIFLQYMREIPYVSQVNVLTYIRRTPPAKDFIELEIVVERETQKAIMIGKEGSALKTLATASRLDIEDFVGREVYIEVKVKVKENWRTNEGLLRHYGYSGQVMA